MTGGRAASWAWLAVLAPLWLVMVACTRWEPIAYDGWNSIVWHRWNRVEWGTAWDLIDYGWTYSNPRLGQLVTILLYTPGPYHPIITPLLELALFWLMTALALARWPSLRRADDALAFAVVVAITAACTPQLGPMLFYRPYTGNYLVGLAVSLAWLVPYRFRFAPGRGPGRWWWSPALLVLGFAAGMCNEHTGPAFLALGGLAVARSVRRGDGARPWMLAGLAGLLAGYVLLLVAPGNDLRYDGLARQAGILERIGDRGALEDLWLVTRLAVYAAWALPWLLLGVAARRIAPAPPGEAAGREQRLAWIALAAAGELAALALLASPKLGPRLYFASVALVAIAIAGWLLPRLTTARLKLPPMKTRNRPAIIHRRTVAAPSRW